VIASLALRVLSGIAAWFRRRRRRDGAGLPGMPRCNHAIATAVICGRVTGHTGDHAAQITWPRDADEGSPPTGR